MCSVAGLTWNTPFPATMTVLLSAQARPAAAASCRFCAIFFPTRQSQTSSCLSPPAAASSSHRPARYLPVHSRPDVFNEVQSGIRDLAGHENRSHAMTSSPVWEKAKHRMLLPAKTLPTAVLGGPSVCQMTAFACTRKQWPGVSCRVVSSGPCLLPGKIFHSLANLECH